MHKIIKTKISYLVEFLKYLIFDKQVKYYFILFLILTPPWIYITMINFSWLDIVLQSLFFFIGWRIGGYGLLGFIPGGGIIAERHYHTIRFWPILKTWRVRWMFLIENTFSVDFFHIKKEMFKGDPTSVREVTGPVCMTVGIGFNKYIFDLE